MPEYLYIAQTSQGTIARGRISSATPDEAREQLSQQGQRLVSIEAGRPRSALRGLLASLRNRRRSRAVRSSDVELMLQQLAVMLESGLELTPSLKELVHISPGRRQQQLCAELATAVEQGKTFASALAESRAFPLIVIQLVRVGEESGELPVTLQRAALFIESRRQAISGLLAALAYPLLVAVSACAVAAYLVGWAIPKLAAFLHALGRKLPSMTQSLLDVSSVVQQYGPQVAVAVGAALIALGLLYAWRPGRYRMDRYLLRLPLIGPVMVMAATHQLADSLSLMLRSGVFLPDALRTAASLHRNQYLAAQVAQSCNELALGKDLASSFGGPGFAPMLSSMMAVGERTGDLPRALEHVAHFYAAQVDASLKRVGRLIEPAIIVVVGGIVGYVYVAFFMALMSAGGNFR